MLFLLKSLFRMISTIFVKVKPRKICNFYRLDRVRVMSQYFFRNNLLTNFILNYLFCHFVNSFSEVISIIFSHKDRQWRLDAVDTQPSAELLTDTRVEIVTKALAAWQPNSNAIIFIRLWRRVGRHGCVEWWKYIWIAFLPQHGVPAKLFFPMFDPVV